ncbi:MAG: hypothetical protein GY820_06385 [Gammaproteobacteria bacterium]|nr:hypothetical protein [Gammaproteobacteria bacterium]
MYLKYIKIGRKLYACISVYGKVAVQYIVSYISKDSRGMSQLLSRAAKESKAGNQPLKQQFRLIMLQV